eukprot:snap_masked-scaffold_5-processed-gene-14.30-mRNA-1 protein AED:1.00 eAED:1.00 QI:0/0/0/0/1/1/2/0/105
MHQNLRKSIVELENIISRNNYNTECLDWSEFAKRNGLNTWTNGEQTERFRLLTYLFTYPMTLKHITSSESSPKYLSEIDIVGARAESALSPLYWYPFVCSNSSGG